MKVIIIVEIILCAIIVVFHMQEKFSFIIVEILKKILLFLKEYVYGTMLLMLF